MYRCVAGDLGKTDDWLAKIGQRDLVDIESISEAMVKIASYPETRTNLIAKGIASVQRFSWDRCAEETYNLQRFDVAFVISIHHGKSIAENCNERLVSVDHFQLCERGIRLNPI